MPGGNFYVVPQDGAVVSLNHNAQANRIETQVNGKIISFIDCATGIVHMVAMTVNPAELGLATTDGIHVQTAND